MTRLDDVEITLGKVGLGVEHFVKLPIKKENGRELTIEILQTAYELGITHYDLVFNLPYFFDIFGEVFADRIKQITLTSHFGTVYNPKNKGAKATRSVGPNQLTFEDTMKRLDREYTDIGLIQYIRNQDDYEKIKKKAGLLNYVQGLKETGEVRALGISGHDYPILLDFIQHYEVDVIMTIINYATGSDPRLLNLIEEAKKQNIAIIGIKTLMKGKVLSDKTQNYGAYYSGGKKLSIKLPRSSYASECFNYVHSLGADTVVFGVQTVDQLRENLLEKDIGQTDDILPYFS
ncbi:MAG: aldo/keto reductase [Candidatus Heimdallarchaeota archaeon]|nr:aldo/keto reductase [Candidatus Heimdallarchaeota archaeon]